MNTYTCIYMYIYIYMYKIHMYGRQHLVADDRAFPQGDAAQFVPGATRSRLTLVHTWPTNTPLSWGAGWEGWEQNLVADDRAFPQGDAA